MDISISYLLADLDWSFRKVHVATLLVAVYCNIPRLFIFSINGVSFSSLLYICMDIFFLIFMHSRSFLQSTGGTELLIHSSYIICFVSNFNLFRPLFSWKLLLLQFENASRNFAGLMFICFASHLTKLISLISSPTNSLTMLCKSSNFFCVFKFFRKFYSFYSFLI